MWPRSRSARARRTDLTTRTDSGFSLIELMVVVLIISILVVIALPVFAGARDRAADKAAESNLRNALPAAVSYYVDTSSYDGFDPATGKAAEPSIDWVGAGPPNVGEVAIQVASGPDLLLIALSRSGTYFCISQIENSPQTGRGKDKNFNNINIIPNCTGGW